MKVVAIATVLDVKIATWYQVEEMHAGYESVQDLNVRLREECVAMAGTRAAVVRAIAIAHITITRCRE